MEMKCIIALILSVISLKVCAQKEIAGDKVFIGFHYSPDYSFRTIKRNGGNSSTEIVIRKRNELEVAKFGCTTGLNIGFIISHHFSLVTGVQYANKGYKTENKLIYFPQNPDMPVSAKIYYSYHYLGIPVQLRFLAGKGN